MILFDISIYKYFLFVYNTCLSACPKVRKMVVAEEVLGVVRSDVALGVE